MIYSCIIKIIAATTVPAPLTISVEDIRPHVNLTSHMSAEVVQKSIYWIKSEDRACHIGDEWVKSYPIAKWCLEKLTELWKIDWKVGLNPGWNYQQSKAEKKYSALMDRNIHISRYWVNMLRYLITKRKQIGSPSIGNFQCLFNILDFFIGTCLVIENCASNGVDESSYMHGEYNEVSYPDSQT